MNAFSLEEKVIANIFTVGSFPGVIVAIRQVESEMQFGDEIEYETVYDVKTDHKTYSLTADCISK